MRTFALLSILFGLMIAVNTSAQTCTKSAAAKAALLEADIIQKVNPGTGEVTYLRKSTCPMSGKTSYTAVEYCTKSGRFITAAVNKKETCVKKQACTGYYTAEASATTLPAYCTTAQKAACIQAGQKATAAKAAFVANNGVIVKP